MPGSPIGLGAATLSTADGAPPALISETIASEQAVTRLQSASDSNSASDMRTFPRFQRGITCRIPGTRPKKRANQHSRE